LFANCNQLVEDTFTTQSLTVSTVAETLELPSSDADSVVLTVLNVLSNAAWAALGVAAPEASVAAGLLAAGFTAALAGTAAEGGGSISVAYIRLQTELNNWFSNSLTGIGKTEAAVVGDGGLLAAVGKMIQNGTWQWPSTLTPQLVAAAQQQYTISLWQILLPIAWERVYANNDCNKLLLPLGFPQDHHWHDPATNRCYWPVKAGSILIAKYPSSTTWDALFDSPPNGLGIPMADVFLGQNGWPKLKVAVGLGAVLETPQDLLEMFIG